MLNHFALRSLSFTLFCCTLLLGAPATFAQPNAARERIAFNSDWRFQKGDPVEVGEQLRDERSKDALLPTASEFKQSPTSARTTDNIGGSIAYVQSAFDDKAWRRLDLPHDWGSEGESRQELPGETGKLEWSGVGWYRKHFTLPAGDRARRVFLDTDGAMAYAAVWLNGQFVGGWPYGYASFRLDLTPHLKYGAENVLAIRLDNPPDSSRWCPGGGIYRNVWLVKTAPVHVGHYGTYITTPDVTKDRATATIKVTVSNQTANAADVSVRTLIYEVGADGRRAGKTVAASNAVNLNVATNGSQTAEASINIPNPKL